MSPAWGWSVGEASAGGDFQSAEGLFQVYGLPRLQAELRAYTMGHCTLA